MFCWFDEVVGVDGGRDVGFFCGEIYWVEFDWLFVVVVVLFFVGYFGGSGN